MAELRIEPNWMKFDKKVLRYRCFFQEAVQDNPNEAFRFRKCVACYHLEDDSMWIVEPRIENSGLNQGVIVGRAKTQYRPRDLICGGNFTIFSVTYHITAMDDFTKEYYSQVDLPVGEEELTPRGPFDIKIEEKLERARQSVSPDLVESRRFTELLFGGNRVNRNAKQYIDNDRRVLRFYSIWDDPSRFGVRSYLVLHYFLADDSVEVIQPEQRNSGRADCPVIYRRSPLPKKRQAGAPGLSPYKEGDFYRPKDFFLGKNVEVLGRDLFLYDCDEFTRQYYSEVGVDQMPCPLKSPVESRPSRAIPPHTGFGSEEDSMQSVKSLIPKALVADMQKKLVYQGVVLRFEAVMISKHPEDSSRRFVLSYFMADDGISVYELKQRNSGMVEGCFAAKARFKWPEYGPQVHLAASSKESAGNNFIAGRKSSDGGIPNAKMSIIQPGSPAANSASFPRNTYTAVTKIELAPYIESEDMFVGAEIPINGYVFKLMRADEYSLKFMEETKFAVSDMELLANKIKSRGGRGGIISAQEAQQKFNLLDHEVITLMRNAKGPADPLIDLNKL